MKTLAPSQTVEFEHGGRYYGRPGLKLAERAKQGTAPEIGIIFLEDLVEKSAILALPEAPTRDQILEAYGTDIHALGTRRQEADGFLLKVLECAMDRFNLDFDKRQAEETLLQKLLAPLGITPQIGLTAERSTMRPADLAEWLKEAFQNEIHTIATRIAATLHYLADANVIGLVDWAAVDACKFHYFTWSAEHEKAAKQRVEGDIFGWNSLVTTTIDTATLARMRHTHHVVRANTYPAGEYGRPMPERVKALMRHAPAWLMPHLIVIDGDETLAEKVIDKAGTEVHVETESVMRYDPALAIGPFVLAGWNESETSSRASHRFHLNMVVGAIILIFAMVGLIVLLYWPLSAWVNSAQKREHESYIQSHPGQEFTVAVGQKLNLPIGQLTLEKPMNSRDVRLGALSPGEAPYPRKHLMGFDLGNVSGGVAYGDINLGPHGLPFILHVHSATESEIRYTLERTPEELEAEAK